MRELFTDDEIVAVSAGLDVGWPVPLVSVRTEMPAAEAAAFRGLRSLIVRGLATPTSRGPAAFDPAVAALVGRAARCARTAIAHVSGVAAPALAGAAVAAFVDDAGAVLDVVTATGIHAIQECDPDVALTSLEDFARSRYAPDADAVLSPDGCVLAAASEQEVVARVRPGLIELGRVVTSPIGSVFEATGTGDFGDLSTIWMLGVAEGTAR